MNAYCTARLCNPNTVNNSGGVLNFIYVLSTLNPIGQLKREQFKKSTTFTHDMNLQCRKTQMKLKRKQASCSHKKLILMTYGCNSASLCGQYVYLS